MTETEKDQPYRNKYLLVLALLFGLLSVAWFFYLGDEVVVTHLKNNWVKWYGVKWFEAPRLHTMSLFFVVAFVPAILFGVIAGLLGRSFYYANFASVHEANLRELSRAKIALQQSLSSIDAIENDYRSKVVVFERLRADLEALHSAKEMDTEELRKKLSAIAIASSKSVWLERSIGFATGVVSSILASYIWERLLR